MQKLGFGTVSDTTVLVRCLEALFLLLQCNFDDLIIKWTETIVEAFFLQLSVFGSQNGEGSNDDIDYA